jgi:hypothetical protein
VSNRRIRNRTRTIRQVVFELTRSHYRALEAHIWSITSSVPGIRQAFLQWVPGCGYYLTLSGSRRAVVRIARLANIPEDEIQQRVEAIFGTQHWRL